MSEREPLYGVQPKSYFKQFILLGILGVSIAGVAGGVIGYMICSQSTTSSTCPTPVDPLVPTVCHMSTKGNWSAMTGVRYPDTNLCECVQCWYGDNCENFAQNCTIVAGDGQPHMMFDYWHNYRLQDYGNRLSMPLDYRVEYQFPPLLNRVFSDSDTEGLGGRLNVLVRKLHAKYHNIDTKGKYVVFASGASQLTSAAMVAFANQSGKALNFFAKEPYYFAYPYRCGVMKGWCNKFNSSEEQEVDDLMEIVTIPNNPDGEMRKPFYKSPRTMLDAVYYWPSLAGNPTFELAPLVAPVSLFSFTKLTGHAGSRFGWAVVEDPAIADGMYWWDALINVHIGVEQAFRASLILEYMIGAGGDHFFNWVRSSIAARWVRFQIAVATQPLMTIRSRVNTQYAWVEVNRTDAEIDAACAVVGLAPERGVDFGAVSHIRFNLAEHEVTFTEVLKRIILLNFTTLPATRRARGSDPRLFTTHGP